MLIPTPCGDQDLPAFLCKRYILVKISWINMYEMLATQYMMQAEKHSLLPQPCGIQEGILGEEQVSFR